MEFANLDVAELKATIDRDGYAIIKGVFTPDDVAKMSAQFDEWFVLLLLRLFA
jgi:hypothetical protein